ncbi:MAG TPA: type III secretion inner membrane ring lipoprotein SctJ [Candidatus Thiothrix moscowensis]|uniref:type III secretion system inner membrane ring lipoprotein SctJ n=1 Tax=unclassified Thiothrix TaxID=2636184 RepID=UPI001A2309BE|nr:MULTISPECIES: type III secretion inner membrane ring lipoprotein SctJ [unclassified Thiothrix]MBJ6611005.1 type III secretion inner membrane ring lipoprotein SctJ [Candidatus Thiothrix moscowensis]HRJ54062.1 type III secretion inner membrane ring lipoprotein SctJ [Candidatus Thiothrix moscowensis]HRJ94208.1 type III secretion inner membrane ring lipoprotein SctJ [Candidatus Thiothrix moscowensis]
MTTITKKFCQTACLLAVMLLAGCKTELYSNLDEQDSNAMLAILLDNGIDAAKTGDKKAGTYFLHVADSSIPQAINLLKEHGYPREKAATIGELFKKDGLISSPLEERARFIFALSQSVQETLSQIDGVLIARVHVVLPENNPLGDQITPSSASVFIKYNPEYKLEDMKSDIKLIVEKSIEGLSYDKVSVVMVPAQLPARSSL